MKAFFKRFFDNFANPPEPGPPLIPERWRIPFFVTLVIVSIVALGIVIRFVVVPGISEQSTAPKTPVAAPASP